MKKKLLSGLFWVLLLNLLIKPFWLLGIEVGVQNAVGAEQYGFYFAIFNLAYIFNILLDMGVTNFNTRNIAQYPQLIDKHLSGILCLKVMLMGLFVLVTFSVGLLLGYDSRQFVLLAWLCLNQFLNSLILYLRSNFEGLLLFKADSVLSIMDRVLMIAICGGLLLWRRDGFAIEWFVYAQTAGYVVTALVALIILARKTGLRRLRWSRPFALAILKKSAPFALLVLLMASYNRIDPVLIERLLPDGTGNFQAGIYAGAFRLLDALTMVAYLVSVPLLPVYARLTAKKASSAAEHAELRDITRMIFSLMMVFAVSVAVTCSFMSEPLMALLYSEHVAESARVFRILIYGIIPIAVTYVFGTLLTANGSLRQLNLLATTALALNIGVNLLLIPRLQAYGSAWASITAQSFMAAAQVVVALRIFHITPQARYVVRLLAFVAIVVAANIAATGLLQGVTWWAQGIAVAVVAVASGFALRLINLKEIQSILQNG